MAINVTYGPIAQALGLAQVAGAGQGRSIQSQRDLAALQLQDQMQRTINQNNANTMQLAMAKDEQAKRDQLQQDQLHQQSIQQQAQNELAQQNQTRLNAASQQQNAQFAEQQQTREGQAKAIAAAKDQELKDKQARETWLQTLTPEQRNAVLSGAGLPMAKPPAEISPNSAQSDQRIREAAAVEALKTKAEMDMRAEDNLRRTLLPDPATVESAHNQTQASLKAYQEAAQKFSTGPANVAGLTAAPTKDQPTTQSAATQPAAPANPGGPPPGNVYGARAKMPDGSMWKWTGLAWVQIQG